MRVLFIGVGSIAKRHILNLRVLYGKEVEITVLRSGKGATLSDDIGESVDRVCRSDKELDELYDAVFITNPTALHHETLLKYHGRSDAFFIEKPVFVTGREDINPFLNTGKKYYVACPLRYTNVIQWLRKKIDFSKVYSIRVISSSYLPDWRPGTDYRNSYSAHKNMGGGVSIDLIHEWDYICYLVGRPISVQSLIRKKSDLEIDADDIAVYIAEYEDKVVEIHLDYFGRKAVRQVELYAEEDTIVADLINQKLEWRYTGKQISLTESRDDYQKKELLHFMDIVSGKADSDNNLEEACEVLQIARGGK